MRRLELGVYVLLASALAAALVLTLVHASKEVYYIPGYGVAIAAGALVVAAAGMALGWRSRRGRVVAVATLAGALGVVSVLSMPLVLVIAAALMAVAIRMSRGPRRTPAIAGGVMLGVGLHVLALIALSPPLVDCETGSAGQNVFLGMESDVVSGGGSVGADGTSRGRARGETYEYSYACRDSRLVDFELRR